MGKPESGLMLLSVLILMGMYLTGCATIHGDAICDATKQSRKELAQSVLEDGGSKSQLSALFLLDQMKAGCNE